MEKLRIIFMGTPEFAVPSLQILLENNYSIVGVITAPDKTMGRGLKVGFSPVKEIALQHHLHLLQPTNLKDLSFLEELRQLKADLQIVVAFRMLPQVVWSMPSLGTFNLHASLLPQYRGAAPINWAIINGEKETGVTTFFLKQEIDTGDILFQEKEPIHLEDNAGILYDRLMKKGAQLVLKTVQAIEKNNYKSIPQPVVSETKLAPKLFREMGEINWNQSVEQVRNFVRGLSPYPAAWIIHENKQYKIYKVNRIELTEDITILPGKFITDHKTYLYFKCQNGFLAVEEIQAEGKKRMGISDFLKGNKF